MSALTVANVWEAQFFIARASFSQATEFVVLLQKWAKPQNLGFFAEIVKFLEIHFKTNVLVSSSVPATGQ